MTVEALKSFDIGKKDAERAKNMFALGLLSWLYHRPTEGTLAFLRAKFAKSPTILAANIAAFKAGWAFGETTEDFAVQYEVKPAVMRAGTYRNITGNVALAYGLVAAGVRTGLPVFLGSYPITPASFGGNPGPQSTVTIYDIATNTWSSGAAMPVATTYGRSTVAGSFAYYAGGITTVTTNAVYRYNFAANTWATMAPLGTARTSEELMTSPDNSKLFAVMGGDATFFTGVPLAVSVEIYDIAANTWTLGNPVVTKAAAPSGGLAGGKLMVQGGVDGTTYYDLVQVSNLGGCASPDSNRNACKQRYTDSHTHVCGRQPIHDKPDWRQHRARHDRHRQSRG